MENENPKKVALYPGSFDPFTMGHLDIVERAVKVFDSVEITVAVNAEKKGLFSLEERCGLIRECV